MDICHNFLVRLELLHAQTSDAYEIFLHVIELTVSEVVGNIVVWKEMPSV